MRPGETVLQEARRKYDIATSLWREQRAIGGIVPLDREIPEDNDALAAGAKYKCATPAAVTALGVWQKCKAELDAAAVNNRRAAGDESCSMCPRPPRSVAAVSADDTRLPPERDEDGPIQ